MDPPDAPLYLRKRYYVISLMFVGYILMSLLRINLSICLVDLISNKTITKENVTYIRRAELDWTPPQVGFILSSFSWGFIFSPVGAMVANKFGGVTVFTFTNFLTGFLTLFSPFLIKWNLLVFMIIRISEGLLQGVAVASAYTAFVKWVPPRERARLINLSLLGLPLGSAISYPVTGYITHTFDWKCVFYLTGGVTIIWYLITIYTMTDSPLEDKLITHVEKSYFKEVCVQVDHKKVLPPWKSILTSIPVLAYLNDRFVESWSYSFLLTCIPLYIKDVYPGNIKDIGFLSGIPHMFSIISIIVSCWLLDYLRSRKTFTKTKLHKTYILFGQVSGAIFFTIIGFWSSFYVALIALSLFKICYSCANVSYHVLPYDMSLQHANALAALSMTSKSLGSIINPIIMGFMVQNHSAQEWSRYFWFLSFFNLWGAVVFAKFGSAELQLWGQQNMNTEERREAKEKEYNMSV